ncbi:hypothetical protein Angca_006343 [Angiostrongylus cantonensis]|nr:hypothetical protein Angca_006343 [Angiostrongylus cantonensis]
MTYTHIYSLSITMPSDRTPCFKACVKSLKNKSNVAAAEENDLNRQENLRTSLAYKKMVGHALSLGKDIVEFQQVVLSRRCDYLSFNSPTRIMDDFERDMFDRDTEKVLSQLSDATRRFSSQTASDLLSRREEKSHLTFVAASLDTHLKRIGKMVTDMRTLRLCSAAQKRNVQRLYNLVEAKQKREREHKQEGCEANTSPLQSPESQLHVRRRRYKKMQGKQDIDGESRPLIVKSPEVEDDSKSPPSSIYCFESQSGEDIDSWITYEERTQLVAENERLLDRFSHMHSQIEGLETQIAEIQRLQETFAEKIMDQEKDIEIINEAALQASENLRDGNEWIRQAISNSAGRRVVVLFCIVVITFTLLFIDWYNP